MSESKKYTVTILGESYSLVSDESDHHVQKSAELVNTLMKEISEKSKTLDMKKVAVLAAVCIASNVKHLEAELAELNIKHEELVSLLDQVLPSDSSSSVA